MNLKPVLRLVIVTQAFLLFAVISLPYLIRSLQQPAGKVLYGVLSVVCIGLVLLLRRALSNLE